MWAYSHNVPTGRRKCGYIPITYQSDAGNVGIFPKRTNQASDSPGRRRWGSGPCPHLSCGGRLGGGLRRGPERYLLGPLEGLVGAGEAVYVVPVEGAVALQQRPRVTSV
eukprot:1195213-Prorocentrum_minimum.AAC.6